MKRSKKLYALSGILVVLSIGTFSVLQYQEHQEIIKKSDAVILEIPTESVTALSWETKDVAHDFYKDEAWFWRDDQAFPVDEAKVNALLEWFEHFGVAFIIEDVEDYGQYGLDNPVCTIRLTTDDDKVYEVVLGGYSAMDAQRYVSIGDGNVYLVQEDPLDAFAIALSDMIEHDSIPPFNEVSSIQFTGLENYTIFSEEESDEESERYFVAFEGERVPLDTARVVDYLQTISYLDLEDYVTYNVTSEELVSYGLDEPKLTVAVTYTYEDEDETIVEEILNVHIGQEPDTEQSDTEPRPAYARVDESQIVYQLTPSAYEGLEAAAYDDLRHTEVITADLETMNQIEVKLDDATYTITREGDGEKRSYHYLDQEIEGADLEMSLKALVVDTFTDEGDHTAKEEIGMTLYFDDTNEPEILVKFYQYDGTDCLVTVDGETIGFVERALVVDLIESVNKIILE